MIAVIFSVLLRILPNAVVRGFGRFFHPNRDPEEHGGSIAPPSAHYPSTSTGKPEPWPPSRRPVSEIHLSVVIKRHGDPADNQESNPG